MKKAFTIVELLVVMAVIGVLITLAVVGIQAIQRAQRETVRQNDLRNLQAKIEEYYGKFRIYPNFDHMVVSADGKSICLLYPSAANASSSGANNRCNSNITQNSEFFSTLALGTPLNTFGDPLGYVQWFIDLSYSFITTHYQWGCTGSQWVGTNAINADNWVLLYSISQSNGYGGSGASQQYRLGGCTENGPIAPVGTKLD
jgi:prepilin-type N-terminal cleavage/methylation domain-containing protein